MKYVILSPHIDDETIGCWRLLNAGLVDAVIYFFDITEERFAEAVNCSNKYGFKRHICLPTVASVSEVLEHYKDHIILAPEIYDTHGQHKQINVLAKTLQLHRDIQVQYYSISMNKDFVVLEPEHQQQKKSDLLELFPSQQGLLTSDEKYFLFESLIDSDISKTYKYSFSTCDIKITTTEPIDRDLLIVLIDNVCPENMMSKLIPYLCDGKVSKIVVSTDFYEEEFIYG